MENKQGKVVSKAPDVANGDWMFYWGNGQAGVTHDQAAYPESTEYQVVVRIAESAADGILNEDFNGLADYNEYLRSNGFPTFRNLADFVALQIKLHFQTVVNGDISFAEKCAQAVHLSANVDETADRVAIEYANTYIQSRKLVDTPLFHVTSKKNLASIKQHGLKAETYLASESDLADYYAETVEDEGESPVVLQVALADLDESLLRPDLPSIDEPITTVLNSTEEEIHESWGVAEGTWQDSLELVKSIKYEGVIQPKDILVVTTNDVMLLTDYMQSIKAKKPKGTSQSLGM